MDIFGIVFARKKTLKKQREELLKLIHDFYFLYGRQAVKYPEFLSHPATGQRDN